MIEPKINIGELAQNIQEIRAISNMAVKQCDSILTNLQLLANQAQSKPEEKKKDGPI